MKRNFLTIGLLFLFSILAMADNGYEIKIKLDGFEEKELYLGHHYGDKQYITDTVQMDAKGFFVFKGEEELKGGVYLIIMPPENQYFQILINEGEQHFSIRTQKENPPENIKIKGSPDNEMFYKYLGYLGEMVPKQKALHEEKNKKETSEKRKKEIDAELKKLDETVKKYHRDLVAKYPNTLTGKIVKSRLEMDMPEFEGDDKEKQMQRYLYYKKHYFDNIDLDDPRMARTPFLFQRVTYYMEKLTPQHPDSMAKSLDYLLEKMKPADENFKYYLIHFINKYASSKVVGQDAIYVHLADNYYSKGLAPWTKEDQLEKIIDNARRLKPVLIGKKARNITTIDSKGGRHNLHDIDAEYTILYFWAPDCGHCKKMTPFLIDFHEKYKTKGVKIMTICRPKTGIYQECWDYIDENENMDNMINTHDPSNRAQIYYNIRSTPVMFILNKEKEIIMKSIGADQLEEVMDEIILRDQKKLENK